MFTTVVVVLLILTGISILVVGLKTPKTKIKKAQYSYDEDKEVRHPVRGYTIAAGTAIALVGVFGLGAASVYSQSIGQAKVLINAGGTIAGQDATPGWAIKAPWQSVVNWDLFSQTLTFAGNKDDGAPSYTGGQINGYEITSSVARGAQTDLDVQVVYNLDGSKVGDLYKQFRSQERFTKQVIEPKVLAVIRTVPTDYTPVEFRGEKRGEATQKILDGLNKALNSYGITVSQVNLQAIRYTSAVEDSIKAVEVAQQSEAEQQAKLRAATVEAQQKVVQAQATADAARIAAQGQADANATLSASLTPQVLQQRYIDALKEGTIYVVPEGSTPFVQTK